MTGNPINDNWFLGQQIREARNQMELTQEQAADAIQKKYNVRLSPSYLSMIESGDRKNLTHKLLQALYDFFSLDKQDIVKTTSPSVTIDLADALENSNIELLSAGQKISPDQRLNIARILNNQDVSRPISKPNHIPILGTIRAGIPLLAEENYAGELDIPADVRADFALQVKGDSMIGVGIHAGDFAVCRQPDKIKPGDIVVALRDIAAGFSEATLKFYFEDKEKGAVLRAANPDYEDIIMDKEYRIAGVVVALIRKEPPEYWFYQDYIASKEESLQEWNKVIEKAIQCGIKPGQVEEMMELQWQMARKIAGKK